MALRIEGAPDGIAVSIVSVGNTAVQVVAKRRSRRQLLLVDTSGGLSTLFFGPDDTVTSSTGTDLLNRFSNPLTLDSAAELWAISSSGSNSLTVIELYDVED